MKKFRFISSLAFNSAFFLLLSSCSSTEKPDQIAEKHEKAPQIETFTVSKDKLVTTLSVPGELVANQEVDIYQVKRIKLMVIGIKPPC